MATSYDTLQVDISTPNDGQGDPLRTAFDKINQRFTELRIFLNNRGDWTPSTVYTVNPNRDWVIVEGVGYLATENHTSGATFAADLAAGKWVDADSLTAIQAVDDLRADLASTATGNGAELVGFKQSGTGAVDRTVQADSRERVNIKQFGGVGDGVADDTQAFINAKALGRAINLPPGEWVITQPVAFSVSIFGESAYDNRTVIRLDGAGQLIVDDAYMIWRGFYVKSAVSNKTFIKCAHSGWTFEDFRLEKVGSATGQVGIEFDTTDRSVYFTSLEKFKIRLDYPVRVIGANTESFNANKLGGTVRDYWQDFASAIAFDGAMVADANHIAGYFEGGTNAINIASGKFRQNRLDLLLDNVTRAWNQAAGINEVENNFWTIHPDQFVWAGQYPKNQYGVPTTKVRATNTANDPIPNAAPVVLKFDSEIYDSLGEFANELGVFTAKNAGYYMVDAAALSASVAWDAGERWEIRVYKNGVEYAKGDWNVADAATTRQRSSRVVTTVYLNGTTDTIDVRLIHNQGGAVALDGSSAGNYIDIAKLP